MSDEYGLDWYHCEECGAAFDEFEMNYKAAMIDKRELCRKCRIVLVGEMKENIEYWVHDYSATTKWRRFQSLSEGIDWRKKNNGHVFRILVDVKHVGTNHTYSAGMLLFETDELKEQTNDNTSTH